MRMLFVTSPGLGHLLPLLPLAGAARARGHAVRIGAGASLAPVIAAAGFEQAVVGPTSLVEVVRAIPEMADTTGRRRAVSMVRYGFSDRIASAIATDLLELAPAWRPDLIVHEDLELGSWLVAERLGIPHATVQATAWRPRVRDLIADAQAPVRERFGVGADGITGPFGQIFFATRPPSLRDPADPLPAVTADLRPVAEDQFAPEGAVDAAGLFPPRDGRPRIVLTLGTVNHRELDLWRALIDGAVATHAHVVVALGADPATLGPVPAGVRVERYVPMSTLLPEADVVGFHGGSGTFLAAMIVGTPVVMTPIAADQLDNGDRCEAAGVGRVVLPTAADASTLRHAFEAVLSASSYRERAGTVAAEIAAMPGPEIAIDRLEVLAGG